MRYRYNRGYRYRLTNPQKALLQARMDNIAIVPASMLGLKALWQTVNPNSANYDFMQEPLQGGEVWLAFDHVARLKEALLAKPDDFVTFPAPAGPKGEDTDPLVRFLKHVESQCEEQEARRVAYVATTRARESLYLLGCANARIASDGTPQLSAPAARSLLQTLWPALRTHFEREAIGRVAMVEPPARRLAIAAEASLPALLRLPADWEFPAAPLDVGVRYSAPPRDPISFEWASDLRRQAGTVIHSMLQRIADHLGMPVDAEAERAQQFSTETDVIHIAEQLREELPAADK